MKRWTRLFYYLMINVIVSACTVLVVLTVWDRLQGRQTQFPLATATQSAAVSQAGDQTQEEAPGQILAPTPTPGVLEYVVQTGDTLGQIAERFGTTIEAITAQNQLDNPDQLVIGTILLIPAPTPTPGAATQTPPGPTPTPPQALPPAETVTPLPANAQVPVEILAVVGAGVIGDERVLIRYNGEGSLVLTGWQLSGPAGHTYTFPQLTLFQNGAISVYTRPGADTVVELYWGLDDPVWSSGEMVILKDTSGNVRASIQVP